MTGQNLPPRSSACPAGSPDVYKRQDLTYSIHKYLFPHIESSAEPSKLMVQLMDEGKLGFKTGEGFQLWSPGQVKASNETLTRGLIQVSRALGRL